MNLNDNFVSKFSEIIDSPDAIVAVEVIEHLEKLLHFLRGCRDILKAGGLLIITTPNTTSARGRLGFVRHGRLPYFNENEYSPCGHITIMPTWLLVKHANISGLTVSSIDYVGTNSQDKSKTIQNKFRRLITKMASLLMKHNHIKELWNGATVIYFIQIIFAG